MYLLWYHLWYHLLWWKMSFPFSWCSRILWFNWCLRKIGRKLNAKFNSTMVGYYLFTSRWVTSAASNGQFKFLVLIRGTVVQLEIKKEETLSNFFYFDSVSVVTQLLWRVWLWSPATPSTSPTYFRSKFSFLRRLEFYRSIESTPRSIVPIRSVIRTFSVPLCHSHR